MADSNLSAVESPQPSDAVSGAAAPNDEPASAGAWLRRAREAHNLTVGDIAGKLRMGARQVQALENADYAALPKGTFLRGFVRNYALVVGLDAGQVLDLLAKTHPDAAAQNATKVVVPNQQNIKVSRPGGELATPKARIGAYLGVALLLCAAVAYWWEFVRPHRAEGGRAPAAAEKSTAMPDPVPVSPATAEPVAISSGGENRPVVVQPTIVEAAPTPAVAAPPQPVLVPSRAEPVVPKGSSVIGFTFSGESWVEVVDAGGRNILSRRFRSGEAEEVVGRPPFSIVIGNAPVTRMAYNGKEFDLAPHTRVAVARVSLK